MHTSGGRVSITINGVVYSARGEIKLGGSRLSAQVGTNQDGTLYQTVTPKPITAECSFDRFVDATGNRLRWNENLLLLNNLAATFIEQDTGVTHLLSNATFVGDPAQNLANGEVDGLSLAAEKYETI